MTPEQIEQIFSQLTLKEKVSLLSGRDSWATNPIDRLGVPELVMTDGPHGVRANQPDAGRKVSGPATAFPTGVAMASTWNPELIEQAGHALGEETKGMGCDILLGPCVNIVRTPIAGRNFEAYSEDPYLTGRIGVAYVKGVQSAGAGTSLKHYAANNQEIERYRGSSEVDERTLREIYLPHFEAVVKEAQPWTVMCSYNRINGIYASQHRHLLREILKEEWGFEGVVVSDWTANHTTTESLEGGLDLEMPGPAKYYGDLLVDAVNIWQIEEAVVDEAARRVLKMVARSGKMDGSDPKGSVNTHVHRRIACQVAEEAITLLKNERGILPITPEQYKQVAIIGPAASEMTISGGGSAYVEPPHRITPLNAIQKQLGEKVEIGYEPGADNYQELPVIKAAYLKPTRMEGVGFYAEYFQGHGFEGEPMMKRVDPRLDFYWFSSGPASGIGEKFSVRWEARLSVPISGRYTLRVNNSGVTRLYMDGNLLFDMTNTAKDWQEVGQQDAVVDLEAGKSHDLRLELFNAPGGSFTFIRMAFAATPLHDDRVERAAALAKSAEVAVVFVGDTEQQESEGFDRPNLRLPGRQDELVEAVAAANPNTIVVLNTGAPIEMPWLDRVAAVVQAYYPGLEGGEAIEKVLTGRVNPSGKLTVTYPRRLEDTPSFTNLSIPNAREVRYGEGIFVGYRYYDTTGVKPLFPFGHGLSYTTFAYSNLRAPETISLAALKAGETFEVSVDLTNTGAVAGKEVVQLYVRDVEASVSRPVKELKGFKKCELLPRETKTITFTLDYRSLAFYDVLKKGWAAEPGAIEFIAAASAEDIREKVVVKAEA